jgi:hypothetical protein
MASLSRVSLFITTIVVVFSHLWSIQFRSTEVAINKTVGASQKRVTINSQREQEGMSPALKRHLGLQIKTLQNAPRDTDRLERLLKAKQRQKEEAMHIEDTPQR